MASLLANEVAHAVLTVIFLHSCPSLGKAAHEDKQTHAV